MSLLIERAHALRAAAIEAASLAAPAVPGMAAPVPEPPAPRPVVPSPRPSPPVKPEYQQQRLSQKPVTKAPQPQPMVAKQEGVAPAPKPAFLLPISVAMAVGGGLYFMLPRLVPAKFTRDESGHTKRLFVSVIFGLILAYFAYRRG